MVTEIQAIKSLCADLRNLNNPTIDDYEKVRRQYCQAEDGIKKMKEQKRILTRLINMNKEIMDECEKTNIYLAKLI